MAARWPVFLVPGNEDRGRFSPQPVDEWPATGAVVLLNRAVKEKGCWLAGVDDPHRGRDDLARALEDIPEGEAVILLAHSPEIIKRSGIERACVIFCGHTHGGQMCLPGGKPLYIRTPLPLQYGSGEHWVGTGNTKLVVSRGAGTTRLPLRLWCPPEVTLWILKSGK
jgi:predicted MPP superfamily phosphohydrolase